MSWNNKVVWSEGMFLQPQHMQQHDRYWQTMIELRTAGLTPYSWGFRSLRIDEQQLGLGKLGLLGAEGVLPDGTPFSLSADEAPPVPLDVPEDTRNELVVLALPLRRPGLPEAAESAASTNAGSDEQFARYRVAEYEARDSNAMAASSALMQIGKLRLRIALESEVVNAHACLGIARVIERRADNKLVLDTDYIPPALDMNAAPKLSGFVEELVGLLHQRGEAVASRLTQPGVAGVAEIADFLLLQLINRVEPTCRHWSTMTGLHPQALYEQLVAVAGELATFSQASKRPAEYPVYQHDKLKETFLPLIADLRASLSIVLDAAAISIPLEERKFGVRVAVVPDPELLRSATFVLAVNAQMAAEAVRSGFPAQVKIGPVEKIRDLVNLQLPGIGLRALPVAPRQLPFYAGFTYFELDRGSDFWKQLPSSAGFALHVAGEFPGLQMQFWAIRR